MPHQKLWRYFEMKLDAVRQIEFLLFYILQKQEEYNMGSHKVGKIDNFIKINNRTYNELFIPGYGVKLFPGMLSPAACQAKPGDRLKSGTPSTLRTQPPKQH